MKSEITPMPRITQTVHALRHIETGEFICLRQDAREYVACFSDGDTARQFREELGLIEYVDVSPLRLSDAPFDNFWLDGDMIARNMLLPADAAVSHSA